MEVLGGTMEELGAHAKALKSNQETTFLEPVKRYYMLSVAIQV